MTNARQERDDDVQRAVNDNNNLAIAFEQYVIRTVESADMLARFVSREYARSGRNIDIPKLTAESGIDKSIYAVVANESGDVVASGQSVAAPINANVAGFDYFDAHVANDTGRLFIGKPLPGKLPGEASVPISRRISTSDGSFGGIIVVHIAPARFTEFYKQVTIRPRDVLCLLGLDGIARARRVGTNESFGDDLHASPVFSLHQRQPNGDYDGVNVLDGIPRIFSYRSVSTFPLIVVTAVSRNAVIDEHAWRRDLSYVGAAVISMLIALFTLALVTAHRRQQQALERLTESDLRFRALGDVLPQLIWTCRPDGSPQLFNQRWFDYTGKSREQSLGDGWLDCIHPADRNRVADEWKRCVETTSPYEIEYRMRRADGQHRWILARSIPMLDDGGAVECWVGTCTDIDEQRKAVAAMQEAQQFARATIDALSSHIAVLDASGTILAVNKAWREFASDNGGSRQAVSEGANYLAVCNQAALRGDALAEAVGSLLRAVAANERDNVSTEYPCHGPGTLRWFSLNITRFGGDGPVRIVASHEEITTRKLAEIALRESEARFKSISANIPGMVFQLRRQGNVFALPYVSEGSHEVLGLEAEQLQLDSVAFFELLDQENSPAFRESMEESQDKLSEWNWEGKFTQGNEASKWINLRATPRRLENGDVIWDGVIFNITRSKQHEESLFKSRQLLQELSARQVVIKEEERKRIAREIHDELGQRLTVLRMDALMLPRTLGDKSAGLRAAMGKMRDSIDGILRIVRNIASELRPPVLDIGIVTAIEWLIEEFDRRSGVSCSFRNLAGGDVAIDDERATGIFRVLQESLTNVARHSRARQVNVTLSVVDGRLCIAISDDGIGFDPVRVSSSKSYGLIGMRERVAMLNGELAITSMPEMGTTIEVCIPF
ncbi:PAS domain-containing protein [Noviherbaspirillum denitrificans]|nr:PAS domain-containing protein [Noviherbaspirillum denitrificans]